MFMHIFVGSAHTYSSKIVLGHSKSIMATRDGSMALSFKPSRSILKVASSTSMEMAVVMSLKSLASATLSLNMSFSSLLMHVQWGYKDLLTQAECS
jgi:hypothetical protein